jgi:dTDP-4-amino-4,6-dideoxygalactose transaminase|tara:strand:+ start:4485 stop:5603 length:1119 start_codon:yes stop_codon:yes gene_type:complete
MIKFLDLLWQTRQVNDLSSAIERVLSSGVYIGGEEVENFESQFSTYTKSTYCHGVSNGQDALRLSLVAAGIKSGDEVIVPAFTFIATWLAVSSIGAKIVPVDVHPTDLSINAQLIKRAITKKTKAIIPVFIFGKVCSDLDEIIDICNESNLFLLFDAAQSSGADYIKDINKKDIKKSAMAWSFYPGKNLGAVGDAGAVTTNCHSFANDINLLRNYGSKNKYEHLTKGLNNRMDPIQASVLCEKLKYLDVWNNKRVKQARAYDRIKNKHLSSLLQSSSSKYTNWHLYVVQTLHRNELAQYLLTNGVETGLHYPVPPYSQPCYADLSLNKSAYAVSSAASEKVLSLPIGPHLTTTNVDKIIDLINLFEPGKSFG